METQTGNLHCLGTSQYISCMFNVYNWMWDWKQHIRLEYCIIMGTDTVLLQWQLILKKYIIFYKSFNNYDFVI
jgi:hypothetical protein